MLGEGDCCLTDGPAAATHGLLMVMSIEIASMLCHGLSQEAVYTHEQLNSTLIGLTTQTDAV